MLTTAEENMVADLRDRGFCVVIFNPEELKDAPPDKVEDALVAEGWEVIALLGDE